MEDSNITLSKSVLEMKFMKKSKERIQKEKEAAEGQAIYSNEITEDMKKTGNIHFVESSIANCLDLVEGRLSFGGMNPEIEKLMMEDYKKLGEVTHSKEKEITDVEMAENYSNIHNDANKKGWSSKKNKHKKKFLKPTED